MKQKYYDLVFITNMPAFYKIRLWNEISRKKSVLAIFVNPVDKSRNKDFLSGEPLFDSIVMEDNGIIKKTLALIRIIRSIKYGKLIFGGWENAASLFLPFFTPKSKNCILCESSIYEYTPSFLKDLVKRAYLKRMSLGYPSGISQNKLLRKLGYTGKIIYTGGCGLLNYVPQPEYEERKEVKDFVYVGRLIEVKNLSLLINVFNKLPNLTLTIIGFGEDEEKLKNLANNNIKFLGAIPNKELIVYYRALDAFVLPSKSETWGLVVEEALNNGLPVIVSDKVGCRDDLVTKETGIVFDHSSSDSLKEAVLKMTDINFYNTLRMGVSHLDFIERGKQQVEAYLGD